MHRLVTGVPPRGLLEDHTTATCHIVLTLVYIVEVHQMSTDPTLTDPNIPMAIFLRQVLICMALLVEPSLHGIEHLPGDHLPHQILLTFGPRGKSCPLRQQHQMDAEGS